MWSHHKRVLVSSLTWHLYFNILHVLTSLLVILLTSEGDAGRFVPCLSCGEVIVNNIFWKIQRKIAFHPEVVKCALSTSDDDFFFSVSAAQLLLLWLFYSRWAMCCHLLTRYSNSTFSRIEISTVFDTVVVFIIKMYSWRNGQLYHIYLHYFLWKVKHFETDVLVFKFQLSQIFFAKHCKFYLMS